MVWENSCYPFVCIQTSNCPCTICLKDYFSPLNGLPGHFYQKSTEDTFIYVGFYSSYSVPLISTSAIMPTHFTD